MPQVDQKSLKITIRFSIFFSLMFLTALQPSTYTSYGETNSLISTRSREGGEKLLNPFSYKLPTQTPETLKCFLEDRKDEKIPRRQSKLQDELQLSYF